MTKVFRFRFQDVVANRDDVQKMVSDAVERAQAAKHSVRVPPTELTVDEIGVLEHVADVVLKAGRETLRELADALERRDVRLAVVCCRKLTSVGWLANEDALKLERRP